MGSRYGEKHDLTCEVCGLHYDEFRVVDLSTEHKYTYGDVRMLLWVAGDDYRATPWKYKRRHTVLGLWHQIKMLSWKEHEYMCQIARIYYEEQAEKERILASLPSERAELERILASLPDDLLSQADLDRVLELERQLEKPLPDDELGLGAAFEECRDEGNSDIPF